MTPASMQKMQNPPKVALFARSLNWLAGLPVAVSFLNRYPLGLARTTTLPALRQALPGLPGLLRTSSGSGRWRFIFLLAFVPTCLAIIYFGFVATDRYVAVAQFVVRTAAKPHGLSGLDSLLQIAGLSSSEDDVYAVQNYMTSLDAVKELEDRLPLREFYNQPGADFIARYPSLFYGTSREQFHRYLQWMISVIYTRTTGVTTITVQAFRPEDARAIALALLEAGERLVNRMNERIYQDAVGVAAAEVEHDQQQLVAAEIDLTNFRNKEMMIDANRSSVIITELIAQLEADVSQTKAQLGALVTSSPNSPQIPTLRGRVTALQSQIQRERSQISNESTGLAAKLATYEQLSLQREFAARILATASTRLDNARVEAQRQQMYLSRVVEPSRPDYAMAPQSLRWIATVFGLNVILLLVVWLIGTGIGEHAAIVR